MKALFRKFAENVAWAVGTPWAFITAISIILVWGLSGPLFGFSEQWQLVINSFTTIVTFLMVFVIQNTQNRDFKALQLKLDELLRASETTHKGLINMHNFSDEDLHRLEDTFKRLGGKENVDSIVAALRKSAEAQPSSPAQANAV